LSSLYNAHERDIYHGDIRPPNIVTSGDQAALIDWDLSGKLSPEAMHFAVFGLPAFVSTSIVTAVAHNRPFVYQRHDDLEALGYSLENLFSGKLIWFGKSSKEIIDMRQEFLYNAQIKCFLDKVQSMRNSNPNYDMLKEILCMGLEAVAEEEDSQASPKRKPIQRSAKKKINYAKQLRGRKNI